MSFILVLVRIVAMKLVLNTRRQLLDQLPLWVHPFHCLTPVNSNNLELLDHLTIVLLQRVYWLWGFWFLIHVFSIFCCTSSWMTGSVVKLKKPLACLKHLSILETLINLILLLCIWWGIWKHRCCFSRIKQWRWQRWQRWLARGPSGSWYSLSCWWWGECWANVNVNVSDKFNTYKRSHAQSPSVM